MEANSFAELNTLLKSPALDKTKIEVAEDEGIVRVAYDGELIFGGDIEEFVHGYFSTFDIHIDYGAPRNED